jgi:hypothetical protein
VFNVENLMDKEIEIYTKTYLKSIEHNLNCGGASTSSSEAQMMCEVTDPP